MSVTILGMPVTSAHETDEITAFLSNTTNKIFITDNNCSYDVGASYSYQDADNPVFLVEEHEEGYNFLKNNFTIHNYSQKGIGDDNTDTTYAYLMEDPIYSLDNPLTINQRIKKLKSQLVSVQADNPDKEVVYLIYNNPHKFCGNYLFTSKLKRLIGNEFSLTFINPKKWLAPNITEELDQFLELKHLFNLDMRYSQTFMFDPSGWFFSNPNPSIILDNTDKTLTQIMDETALTYAELDSPPVIMWSGGIDSNAIVAAFVKNNIPFKVTINEKARADFPELYDHIVANYTTVTIREDLNLIESGITDDVIVTGHCADTLFPGLVHNANLDYPNFDAIISQDKFAEYENYLNTPVDDSLKYNNAESYFKDRYKFMYGYTDEQTQDYWDNYLKPKIDKFPFTVNHWYQLKHYIQYIFQYENEKTSYANAVSGGYDPNKIKVFFAADDFARWQNTNMDSNFELYSQHYTQYKYPLKQYAYDVFGIDSILTRYKQRANFVNAVVK